MNAQSQAILDTDTICRIENLTISFKSDEGFVKAVDKLNLEVKRGKTLGLVGESGSGKSISTKAIMRLLPRNAVIDPASRIWLRRGDSDVIDVTQMSPNDPTVRKIRGGIVGMIFQEPMASFSPVYSVGNQMSEAIRLHRHKGDEAAIGAQMVGNLKSGGGVSNAEAKEIAIDMLNRVGLSNPSLRFRQYAFELSGGMRQRAMIALALSTRPTLLIADEPTTALDVTIQAQILELMQELQNEFGMAMIFITHDMGVISQVADEVAVMYLGRIAERGNTDKVVFDPRHPYTKGLIAAIPTIEKIGQRLTPVPGDIPSPLERPGGCPFHTRCVERADPVCGTDLPPDTLTDPDRRVACWLYGDRP